MITIDTACGREVRVKEKDVRNFEWGPVVMCCWNCASIVQARNSWMQEYA